MIGVFCVNPTNRLRFVLDFMFKDKGQEYKLISEEEEWEKFEEVRLNYSVLNVDCEYSIEPSGLLSDSKIDENLKLTSEGDNLFLAAYPDKLGIIFYVLSRYEEYQGYKPDQHGRFTAKMSQQFELDLLQTPFLDLYVKEIWIKMNLDYNSIQEKFECVPSFDIDVAWAFKGRPIWRTLGGMVKKMGDGRLKVILNKKKDPYDTYSYIVSVSAKVNRIICFALLSDYGKFDKNIHWKNEGYQSLLRGLNSSGGMGIHPGYESHLKPDVQKEEIERLKEIVGHEIHKSRFHFLRFELPKSYDILVKNGIKKDYSMGYADSSGFRAGTSFPFYFFNLETNKQEDLLIFPFVYMDSALKDNEKLSTDEAKIKVKELIDKTANVGGLFICVWHNSSVTNKGEWENWSEVLDLTVDYSLSKKK
ncbi:MAG: hypothetical protein ACI857_000562 [Arenicella sp.]|jgi:hypothetical protein